MFERERERERESLARYMFRHIMSCFYTIVVIYSRSVIRIDFKVLFYIQSEILRK